MNAVLYPWRAVNSIEGQGGNASVGGIGVPFRISGPWSRVSFAVAIGDVVQNEIQSRIRNALSGFIPGRQEEQTPATEGETTTPREPERPRRAVAQDGLESRRRAATSASASLR